MCAFRVQILVLRGALLDLNCAETLIVLKLCIVFCQELVLKLARIST